MATLENQIVLVFGGSSGIGFAVAKASLISLAAKVYIASSSAAKVEDALKRLEAVISEKKLPGKVSGGVVDAKNLDAVDDFTRRVGEIDHLVWSSGDALSVTFPLPKVEQGKSIFDVRFWGAMAAVQAAKIRTGGSITLTNGAVVHKPMKGWTYTAAAAGAIDSVCRGLAVDLSPIRVNCVTPGVVKTELWKDMPEAAREGLFKSSADSLLVKHVGTPEEIAEAYLFLMKCGFITGQSITVDGGFKIQ